MKIVKFLFLFLSISAFAQSKVGTVDVDFILSKMPELPAIQKDVETYGKSLEADLSKKYEAYNLLVEAYKKEEAGYTNEVKLQKQKEITDSENDIAKFQQNGSKMVALKRDEVLRPLYAKIGEALEKVAKAEAFTQVLQINNDLVYLEPEYDLTVKVLNEMGIEFKPE
tara:strand:- start:149498 stop:150001 length:504 start_codon:yes stop_codon:yes gene_type:complete